MVVFTKISQQRVLGNMFFSLKICHGQLCPLFLHLRHFQHFCYDNNVFCMFSISGQFILICVVFHFLLARLIKSLQKLENSYTLVASGSRVLLGGGLGTESLLLMYLIL